MSRWWRRAPLFALVVVLAPATGALADGGRRLELAFDRFNGLYEDLAPELVPVDAGGVGLRLRSERNSVRLWQNRIVLMPRAAGGHRVVATAELEATAVLEAEMTVAGMSSALEDEVTAPRQRLVLEGVVEIERFDAGYLLTVVESPPVLEVAIDSRLAGRVVGACRLAVWVVGCDALERALSRLALPVPRTGERFLVDAGQLTPDERRRIERYLGASGPDVGRPAAAPGAE